MKHIKKYALILDEKDGHVVKLAEKIKQLNFKIIHSTEPKSALEIMRKSNQISIFLINSKICTNKHKNIINEINHFNTSITTFWFEEKGKKTNFQGEKPKVTIEWSSSVYKLRRAISQRLLQYIYPEDLLVRFSEACESSLRKSFRVYATPREPFLRSSNRLFADTTAVSYVQGSHVRGQLAVTTTSDYGQTIYKMISKQENISRNKVWDLMGEICNVLSGAFKACFPESEKMKVSLPTVFHGSDIEVITKYHQPSLVLAFDEEANTIFVEFIFDFFDAENALNAPSIEEISEEDDGDICFL